jgi:hypothetical protein
MIELRFLLRGTRYSCICFPRRNSIARFASSEKCALPAAAVALRKLDPAYLDLSL